MKSYTYSMHGLCQTFSFLFAHFEADPLQFKKAPALSSFLLESSDDFMKDKLNFLHSWCRTCAEESLEKTIAEMEAWVANEKRRTSIKTDNAVNLLFASVYDFNQPWAARMGEQSDIETYRCFGVNGFYNERDKLVTVLTKNGDSLSFWYTNKKDGFALYQEACDKVITRLPHSKDEIILPYVDLHDSGTYRLDGWELTRLTEVKSCTFEHTLQLTDKGAKAKAITRTMTMTKSLPYRPKRIVFDKPFAVAIVEDGCLYPAMVAYCDKDVWSKK